LASDARGAMPAVRATTPFLPINRREPSPALAIAYLSPVVVVKASCVCVLVGVECVV